VLDFEVVDFFVDDWLDVDLVELSDAEFCAEDWAAPEAAGGGLAV
jgi:hypothetical protein